MNRFASRPLAVFGIALIVSLAAADAADARRGGSFGSRGARTYQAPPPTKTAPQQTAPVERSMTAPQKGATPQQAAPAAPAAAAAQAPARRGFGGLGAGILGGLVAGGLIGFLLGNGWGGFGEGFLNTLLQLALIGGVAWLLFRLFRRRTPAPAGAALGGPNLARDVAPPAGAHGFEAFRTPGPQLAPVPPPAATATQEIPITAADKADFERLLAEIQDAFGREDYAALRERTTPEIMSYLAEELGENATQGRRNEVFGVSLLEADVAEAWREAEAEYATCALRYESIDVMRDRTSGAVISGDPERPTEATELWTFVRHAGGPWKLSAIQEA